MAAWMPYVVQVGEALAVGALGWLGVVPGIPAGDWKGALALAIMKLLPTGIIPSGGVASTTAAKK